MEEILSNTPFNNYEDLFNAIYSNKATIKINRSDCNNIAGINHPYFSAFGLYIGLLFNVIITIIYCIFINNYWLLLSIPVFFILPMFAPYIKFLNTMAWIFLIIDLMILQLPIWVAVFTANIIISFLFYKFWWNITYKNCIKELEHNKDAFLWCWNRYGLFIEDCFGNIYKKDFKTNSNQ